ncbi:MAG: hypothetical protein AAB404_00910, partial [Patescibacteria group bacterium]
NIPQAEVYHLPIPPNPIFIKSLEAITTGEGQKIPERAASRARTRERSELGGEQRASEENFDVRRFMSKRDFRKILYLPIQFLNDFSGFFR